MKSLYFGFERSLSPGLLYVLCPRRKPSISLLSLYFTPFSYNDDDGEVDDRERDRIVGGKAEMETQENDKDGRLRS